MKAMYMNYFKDRKLYQWDETREVYLISDTNIDEEFCLDKSEMETFLKFENPSITLGGTLQVQSGNVKANLKLTKGDLIIPNIEFDSSFKLDIDKIKVASKFILKGDSSPILTGVNVSNDQISSTDKISAYSSECSNECNITIANSLIKMLSHLKGEVEFKCNAQNVACEYDNVLYIGRLLNGNYPNVNDIFKVAKKDCETIKINKQELKKFLSYTTNKDSFVILSNNKITINEISDDSGYQFEMEFDLPIEEKLCFAYERLNNIINCINQDDIELCYKPSAKLAIFNNEFMLCTMRLTSN